MLNHIGSTPVEGLSNAMNSRRMRPPAMAPMSDDTNMAGLFGILARYLPSIVLATTAATGLALLYLASATPVYTASTTLFIDPRSRKIVSEEVVQGGLGSDFALVESQVNIIGSDSVLGRVVDALNLTDDPGIRVAAVERRDLVGIEGAHSQPAGADRTEDPGPRGLAQKLKVKRAQKTYVVEIEVSSTSPVKAARLTNAIVDAYIADQTAAKTDEAKKANKLIDSRLGELREQVRKAETRIDEFKKANKILTSEGGIVSEQQLGKINSELITSRAVAAESKARLDQANLALKAGASPDTLPEAMKSGLVQKLRDQYAQVARRNAALASQLRDKHPVLIEVRSQLDRDQVQIAAELKRIAETAKNDFQIAHDARTGDLGCPRPHQGRGLAYQYGTDQAARAGAGGSRQPRAAAAVPRPRKRDGRAAEDHHVGSPHHLAGRRAVHPSKPVTWLILALGALGGMGLGLARALALDHVDPTVNRPRRSGQDGRHQSAGRDSCPPCVHVQRLVAAGLAPRRLD